MNNVDIFVVAWVLGTGFVALVLLAPVLFADLHKSRPYPKQKSFREMFPKLTERLEEREKK